MKRIGLLLWLVAVVVIGADAWRTEAQHYDAETRYGVLLQKTGDSEMDESRTPSSAEVVAANLRVHLDSLAVVSPRDSMLLIQLLMRGDQDVAFAPMDSATARMKLTGAMVGARYWQSRQATRTREVIGPCIEGAAVLSGTVTAGLVLVWLVVRWIAAGFRTNPERRP